LGQAAEAFKKMLPQLVGWALLGFGAAYTFFGVYNDLNWGQPWACPGAPWLPPDITPLECLTEFTFLVELPLGLGMLAVGIVILLIDKMYLSKE
jgi:hypothetical protein